MKNLAIAVIATAALLWGTDYAKADWLQHEYKYWKVWLHEPNDQGLMFCSAQNYSPSKGMGFGVYTFGEGEDSGVTLHFQDNNWDFDEANRSLSFQIDNRGTWTGDATFDGRNIFVWNVNSDVLREIGQGNKIHMIKRNGQRGHWFSLAGSQAALYALYDCFQKLPPVGSKHYY